jgi:hypothetical protein
MQKTGGFEHTEQAVSKKRWSSCGLTELLSSKNKIS